jgi:hypothetical protein
MAAFSVWLEGATPSPISRAKESPIGNSARNALHATLRQEPREGNKYLVQFQPADAVAVRDYLLDLVRRPRTDELIRDTYRNAAAEITAALAPSRF